MTEQSVKYYALICACMARIESYKARNAQSMLSGEPPFYTEEYFCYEATNMETYAKELS